MRAVIQDLTVDYPNPALRADLYWLVSLLDLAGGRSRASRGARADAVDAERAVPPARRRQGFDAITEWFAATLPLPYADSTLIRVRRQAVQADTFSAEPRGVFANEIGLGALIQFEPLRQYTLGALSLRLGDAPSAAAAADKLQRLAALGTANALVRDLDRGLRAAIAWREGRLNDALHLLETLEAEDPQGDIVATPFVSRANERFLRGEVLDSLGRHTDALRWFASLGDGSATEIPLRAPSHLRQAEIYERLGNRPEAARHYARVLELWRDADAEFRPSVDTARQRLTSLSFRTK
jgi:tetratricopeptide (TPR) repeat protein